MKTTLYLSTLVALAAFAAPSSAQDPAAKPVAQPVKARTAPESSTSSSAVRVQLPWYPISTSIVSGKALGEGTVEHVHEGRLVRLGSADEVALFSKDAAKYLADLDKQVIAAQKPTYALTTCAVKGEKLGEMGEPIDVVHEGRLVRLCCKDCLAEFQKSPAPALAKVDAALIAKLKADYKMETCPVSGEKLGDMGEPIDVLHGPRLLRFCCKGCLKAYAKDPAKVVAAVEAGTPKS